MSRMRNGNSCSRPFLSCAKMRHSVSIPDETCSTRSGKCIKQSATGSICRKIFRHIPSFTDNGDAGSPPGFSKISHVISAFSPDFWRTKKARPSAAILDSRTLQSTPERRARAGFDGHKKRRARRFTSPSIRLGIFWLCCWRRQSSRTVPRSRNWLKSQGSDGFACRDCVRRSRIRLRSGFGSSSRVRNRLESGQTPGWSNGHSAGWDDSGD